MEGLSARTILVASAIALVPVYLWKRSRRSATKQNQPPLVGNIVQAFQFMRKGLIFRYFIQLAQTYGKIFSFGLNGQKIHFVTDAANAKYILTSTDFVRGDLILEISAGFFDSALFSLPTGTKWQQHRKCTIKVDLVLQPVFAPINLKNAENIIDMKTIEAISIWQRKNGQIIDINQYFSSITLDVIGLFAYSHNFNALANAEHAEEVQSSMHLDFMFRALAARIFYSPLLWYFLGIAPNNSKPIKAKEYFDQTIKKVINERFAKVQLEANTEIQKNWNMLDRMLFANAVDQVKLNLIEIYKR
jgi:cytochrome P450